MGFCQLRDNLFPAGISTVIIIKFALKLRQELHTCVFYPIPLVLSYASNPHSPCSLQILKTVFSLPLYLISSQLNVLIPFRVLLGLSQS